MTTIRLTNTKTRRKEVFEPIDPQNVRMYVCGPTVYDRAHLGNARPVVVFDVLFRLLRHVYGADHVTYVRNFTDVDDKINAAAVVRKEAGDPRTLEELIRERTEETIRWYHEDMDALGALRPTQEPRATEWIGAMIAMIEVLIEKGHAYVVRDPSNNPPKEYVIFDRNSFDQGHALFDVDSYPGYGQLSGRSLEDMIAGARVEVAPYKRNPADFVLWKPSDASLPGWDSPWGRGRPGWHIECSAMAYELLGESFDIHGGGLDLQFPHHENEIAQSRCARPDGSFARLWMHNEMLQVEGKKMSKSLGNFFTVRDLLDQGIPGEVIRFVLLGTHYGKPMDWTAEKAREAESTLIKWRDAVRGVPVGEDVPSEVVLALTDDLDTPKAISVLHVLFADKRYSQLASAMFLIGLEVPTAETDPEVITPNWIVEEKDRALAELHRIYLTALERKEFSSIDRFKRSLGELGVQLSFTREKVSLASVDLEKARSWVFPRLRTWAERKQVFDTAIYKTSRFEFNLSSRALAYYYFIQQWKNIRTGD